MPPRKSDQRPARKGLIWPKDPQPGNPSSWPWRWRLFDVIKNRGPNIYVGTLRSKSGKGARGTEHVDWDLWGKQPKNESGQRALCRTNPNPRSSQKQEDWRPRILPIGPNHKEQGKKFDYRQRKYIAPDQDTWSKVKYCNYEKEASAFRISSRRKEQHCIPISCSDKNGKSTTLGNAHDRQYGRACRRIPPLQASPSPSPNSGRKGNRAAPPNRGSNQPPRGPGPGPGAGSRAGQPGDSEGNRRTGLGVLQDIICE